MNKERYPDFPGYKGDLSTGKDAAESAAHTAATLREMCVDALELEEFTSDELAAHLGKDILSIRPRLSELRNKGRIEPTGSRRPNKSGKLAAVWRLVPQ